MKQSILILLTIFSLHSVLWAYDIEVPKGKSKDHASVRLPLPKTASIKNSINVNKKFDKNTHVATNMITKKMYQDDLLYETPQFSISKVYPNPAREVAYMNYNLQQDLDAKVTIRNLLGKVVKEYDLTKGNHEIRIPTIQFDAGVYFYTLSINGKSLKAKKLIVE